MDRIRYLYPAFLSLWIVAFGAETVRLAHGSLNLWRVTVRLDAAGAVLKDAARENISIAREIRAQSMEMDFLNSLPDRFPQEKGFLRTQRAVAQDVQTLRRKVGARVKDGLQVLVDSRANKLYVKRGLKLLWQADCSVGRGGILSDNVTGRRWQFVTPRGEFRIMWKGENPVWIKPDWAFVEEHRPIPPPDDPSRKVPGELGAYVLSLGNGYLIHGTKDERQLGRPVSHGCVRLGTDDLKQLYDAIPEGTRVFIY